MREGRADGRRPLVLDARLERQTALPGGGGHDLERERLALLAAQSGEAGRRQHERVVAALAQASQSGVDVPAQVLDAQVGPPGEELRAAAEAARADRRAIR